jgi:hypothetical protein
MIKFRASSIAEIMTDPKGKGEILSVGAKTFIEDMAKEFVYGFKEQISSKYMEKGTLVEQQSIDLRNDVFFTDYKKNSERRENDWITGECDIFTGSAIIDIKSSWSLATFPATCAKAMKDAEKAGYDWQLRAYMWLWNVDRAEVNYCIVNTPDELVGYEDPSLHYVDHIDPSLRVTRVLFERDPALEAKIKEKVEAARLYFDLVTEMIADDHSAELQAA